MTVLLVVSEKEDVTVHTTELPASDLADQINTGRKFIANGIEKDMSYALAIGNVVLVVEDYRPRLHFVPSLLKHERLVIQMLADGLPLKTIAARMNVSRRTAHNYQFAAFSKLKADTPSQAVAIAVALDLCVPSALLKPA